VIKYVLSCASPGLISERFLQDIHDIIESHQLVIEKTEDLSPKKMMAINFLLEANRTTSWKDLQTDFLKASNFHKIDIALMENDSMRTNKKMVVFDMDSTLIGAEVIDEMASVYGIGDQVKLITERAMNGELQFDEALRERVALLKGLEREKMETIFERLPLTPGTERFMKTIKGLGYKTAIVSGGFNYFAESLRKKLNMDYAFANELEFDGSVLNGKVKGEIVNAAKKAALLESLALKEHLSVDQVVAVGDGANDLLMLKKAGLGIAFHAKEMVKKETRHHLSHGPMTTLLYFLGISGNHFE